MRRAGARDRPWGATLPYTPAQGARSPEQPWGSHLFRRSLNACVRMQGLLWVSAPRILYFRKAFLGAILTSQLGELLLSVRGVEGFAYLAYLLLILHSVAQNV